MSIVDRLGVIKALHIMKPIAGLKLVEPAHGGVEFWYGASLVFLEVVVALHGLLFGVVKGHV